FVSGLGVDELVDRENAGWTFRKTKISEQFDFEAARASLPAEADLLLLVQKSGTLRFFTHASRPAPQPGDVVISYVMGKARARGVKVRAAAPAASGAAA
ncbi:MAG TPA: sodium:proton antiporter, partial [Sphingomonadaceae bacterium]|nr:sodium:proton antiporter [Sphingomonadaceae bacterium]